MGNYQVEDLPAVAIAPSIATAATLSQVANRECSGDPTDNTCTRPGIVSINVTVGRSTQVGEFVYHCHILEHEDLGMMARVRVICPDGGTSCGGGTHQQVRAATTGHHH